MKHAGALYFYVKNVSSVSLSCNKKMLAVAQALKSRCITTWSELVLVDRTGWSIMTGTRERS